MVCQAGVDLEKLVRSATDRVIATIRAKEAGDKEAAVHVARLNFNTAVESLIDHRRVCPECAARPISETLPFRDSAKLG